MTHFVSLSFPLSPIHKASVLGRPPLISTQIHRVLFLLVSNNYLMDFCLSNHTTPTLPSALFKPQRTANFSPKSTVNFSTRRFRPLTVITAAGASHCEFSSLNSPLVPRSPAGDDLIGVLLNHPQLFHLAIADELKHLANDHDDAVNRMILSDGSPEACLNSPATVSSAA